MQTLRGNTAVTKKIYTFCLSALLAVGTAWAVWRGVYDMEQDPRTASWAEITGFILDTVNRDVAQWRPGDTVTICGGGNSCIIVGYQGSPLATSFGLFVFVKRTDLRTLPVEDSWWQRLMKWLLGEGPHPDGIAEGDPGLVGDITPSKGAFCSGRGLVFYVDGYTSQGCGESGWCGPRQTIYTQIVAEGEQMQCTPI